MCGNRVSPLPYILNFRFFQYRVAEIAAQVLRRAEVDFATEHPGQFQLHTGESNKTGDTVRLELDEDVDIAVWSEIGPQGRAEDGQPTNAMRPAERFNLVLR